MKTQTSDLVAYGFQSEFVHVLLNILTNAKDAIEEKFDSAGSLREGIINIDIISTNSQINLQIRDNGCGIPKQLQEKIFSPYFTTKGTQSGTGTGLYMSKIIVEKEMKGTLMAENVSDGALFTISLPQMNSQGDSHA